MSECAQGLRCPPGKDATCEDPCATAGEASAQRMISQLSPSKDVQGSPTALVP